jgi:hypothetical protein
VTGFNPQPGDWVKVTAKVLGRPIPEEVEVELFSKSTQYSDLVRVDLCEPTEKPIRSEPDPGSVALVGGIAYQFRGGVWRRPGSKRGVTWVELNGLGDVEVIHHG